MSGNLCRCAAYANIVPAIRGLGAMRPYSYVRAKDVDGAVATLARRRTQRSSPAVRTSWT